MEENGFDKASKFSPAENPYPKGSAEALRYNAARLELARLRSLGRIPPASLMKEVAEGVKVATVGLAVAHPKPKASPAPWLAAHKVFQKAEEAAEGKQIKRLKSSELSELSKSIAEERKKLRLFVVKAKADFEDRKEKAKAMHQNLQMGETDENE